MVSAAAVQCALCGLSTHHPIRGKDGAAFCCSACDQVAQLISEPVLKDESPAIDHHNAETITFSLSGLWCSSCAWLIEEKLNRSKGVNQAQVSYIQRQAQVTFDSSRTNKQKIARQIKRLGYRASEKSESGGSEEEESFFTRLILGGMLAMNIMATSAIMYVRTIMGIASPETQWLSDFFHIMQFVIFIPLVFILGLPVLRAGMASLLRGLPGTHTLVAIGSIAAFLLSARNLYLQSGNVYFDTAAMLLFLISIGRWLEMRAHRVSRESIERMLQHMPEKINALVNGLVQELSLDEIEIGSRVRIMPGERISVDGVIASGAGDVDESMLTGESKPIYRKSGDQLFAGSLNLDGEIELITSAIGSQTRAGQIGRILQEALWKRSPVERLADQIAAWMIPVAIAIAGLTFWYWNVNAGLEPALFHSLSVLLIACPCALGLATPLTLWQAMGKANENGIILRSTAVLEKLLAVEKIYFDKTGTLSSLPFKANTLLSLKVSQEELLGMAGAIEKDSRHPLGQAIYAQALLLDIELPQVTDQQTYPGKGVLGLIDGKKISVGNKRLMETLKIDIPQSVEREAQSKRDNGAIISYVAADQEMIGLIGIGEHIRPESRDVISAMKALKKEVVVITGDTKAAGERWGRLLDVPVLAGLLPEDKLDKIQNDAALAAMVGDGINDGPALASAHVGIALNAGTDLARATADVVLLQDNLKGIPWLFSLADEAHKRVKQNLMWALVYNLIGVALAASGILQPILAAIAMVVSSFLVTQNALRLRRFPIMGEAQFISPNKPFQLNIPTNIEDFPA